METLCPNCYERVSGGAATCPNCGHVMHQSGDQYQQQPMAQSYGQQQAYQPQQAYVPPGQYGAMPQLQRAAGWGKLKGAAALMVVYGILGLLFGIFWLYDSVAYSAFYGGNWGQLTQAASLLLIIASVAGFVGAYQAGAHKSFMATAGILMLQVLAGLFMYFVVLGMGSILLMVLAGISFALVMVYQKSFDSKASALRA